MLFLSTSIKTWGSLKEREELGIQVLYRGMELEYNLESMHPCFYFTWDFDLFRYTQKIQGSATHTIKWARFYTWDIWAERHVEICRDNDFAITRRIWKVELTLENFSWWEGCNVTASQID
jgi:transposase